MTQHRPTRLKTKCTTYTLKANLLHPLSEWHNVLLACKFAHQLSCYTLRVSRTFHTNLHNEIGLACTDLNIARSLVTQLYNNFDWREGNFYTHNRMWTRYLISVFIVNFSQMAFMRQIGYFPKVNFAFTMRLYFRCDGLL